MWQSRAPRGACSRLHGTPARCETLGQSGHRHPVWQVPSKALCSRSSIPLVAFWQCDSQLVRQFPSVDIDLPSCTMREASDLDVGPVNCKAFKLFVDFRPVDSLSSLHPAYPWTGGWPLAGRPWTEHVHIVGLPHFAHGSRLWWPSDRRCFASTLIFFKSAHTAQSQGDTPVPTHHQHGSISNFLHSVP